MFDLLGFGVLMIAEFCVSKLELICVSNLDQWVSNLEIGVDFVNKEDADLLILIGICWVQISGFKIMGSISRLGF